MKQQVRQAERKKIRQWGTWLPSSAPSGRKRMLTRMSEMDFGGKAATGPPVIAGGCWLTPAEVLFVRKG